MAENTTRPARRRTTKPTAAPTAPTPTAETAATVTDGTVEAIVLKLENPAETARYAKFELPKTPLHCGTIYAPKGTSAVLIKFVP